MERKRFANFQQVKWLFKNLLLIIVDKSSKNHCRRYGCSSYLGRSKTIYQQVERREGYGGGLLVCMNSFWTTGMLVKFQTTGAIPLSRSKRISELCKCYRCIDLFLPASNIQMLFFLSQLNGILWTGYIQNQNVPSSLIEVWCISFSECGKSKSITRAFDTVNREHISKILRRLVCHHCYIDVIHLIHNDMKITV